MKEKLKKKLKDFFLSNLLLKKIRNFFNYVILPFLLKAVVIIVALLIMSVISVKFFKPSYFDEVYRKSSFYFLRYLHFDNGQFKEVKVIGNERTSESEIIAVVNEVESESNEFQISDESYQPTIRKIVLKIKKDCLGLMKLS